MARFMRITLALIYQWNLQNPFSSSKEALNGCYGLVLDYHYHGSRAGLLFLSPLCLCLVKARRWVQQHHFIESETRPEWSTHFLCVSSAKSNWLELCQSNSEKRRLYLLHDVLLVLSSFYLQIAKVMRSFCVFPGCRMLLGDEDVRDEET